jgi:sec-independent protein translocase protein TatA
MGGLSWWHWLIILAAFILLFGAKKLPDAARGVGRSLRILKSGVSAMEHDTPPENPVTAPVPPPAALVPTSSSPAPPAGTVTGRAAPVS